MKLNIVMAAVLLCGAAAALPAAAAAAPCASSWDVQHEVALFGTPAQALTAGVDQAGAPRIRADRFYALHLTPQPQVRFAMPPGKVMLNDGAYAGLVRLKVTQPGSYRVSIDVPFWIDVVAGGKELPTEDFTGLRGCSGPHKLVEFLLPANQDLLLQFSGATTAQLHVAITKAPPAGSNAHKAAATP